MATSTAVITRVITFASPAPDQDCLKMSKLHRLGVGWAIVEERPGGRRVVSVKVRAGSVAERYVMRRAVADAAV